MNYRLDELGWEQFQSLCQALLKLEYGNAVEAWGTGADLGRDAYLRAAVTGGLAAPAVFQVKFQAGANAAGARPGAAIVAATAEDISKLRDRLSDSGDTVATYCLITNAPLPGKARDSVAQKIRALGHGVREMVWDGKDVCALLSKHPVLTRAYPQVLSPVDLEAVVGTAVTSVLRAQKCTGVEHSPHFTQGRIAYEKGHVDQALAQWRKAVIGSPDSYTLHNWIGLAYKSKGDLLAAMDEFEHATRLDPDDPVPYYNWGNCLTALERYDGALVQYDSAIALKPDYAHAYGNKAVALGRSGDLGGALRLVVRALELAPDDANLHHNYGSYYMDMDDADGAVKEFRRAVELDPSAAMYHYDLGVAYIDLGNYISARECFQRAVDRRPGWAQAHCNLGLSLLQVGLAKAAERELGTALDLFPALFQAHAGLGDVYATRGLYTAAVPHYQKAVKHGDDSPRVHLRLGAVLGASGDYTAASDQFRLVVAAVPDLAVGHRYLGLALKSMGDDEGAVIPLTRAAELGSDDPLVFSLLGLHYLSGEAHDDARRMFRKALDLSAQNTNPSDHYAMAIACMECGRFDEARGQCEALIRIGEVARGHCTRGHIEKMAGDHGLSIESLREASRLEPTCSEVHARLCDVLLRAGQADRALEEANVGLSINPDCAYCWYALSEWKLAQGHADEAEACRTRARRLNPKVSLRPHVEFCPGPPER
jgi:tetratricopeptide (TPR) repeat protein